MGDNMKEIKKKNFNRVKPSASSGNRALKEDYSKFRKMDFDQYEKYEMNKMDSESRNEADVTKGHRGEQGKKGTTAEGQ